MPSFLNQEIAAQEAEQARVETLARVMAENRTLKLRIQALEALLGRYGELIVTMEIELMDARMMERTGG